MFESLAVTGHEAPLKSVGIVLLSWNRCERVMECIARVKRLSGAAVTIVVIDNASKDDSATRIRQAHPDVVMVEHAVNQGFVGGVNSGLVEATRRGFDYVWLLNDDTLFEDDVLERMLDFAATHREAFIFAPVIRDLHDRQGLQFANGLVDWGRVLIKGGSSDTDYRQRVDGGATPVLTGTALLCDLRAVAAVGSFDPRFFAYWEDIDFTVRAARAGYPSCVVPTLTVYHDSPNRNDRPPHHPYYMIRNEALFWRLHHRGSALAWRRVWLAKALEWLGEYRDLGQREHMRACADAIWDAARSRYGARDESRSSPPWFLRVIAARPHLLAALVKGNLASVYHRVVRR